MADQLEKICYVLIWRFPERGGIYPQSSSALIKDVSWNQPSSYGGTPICGFTAVYPLDPSGNLLHSYWTWCWIYPLIAWWIFPVRYVSFCQRVNLTKIHEKQSFSYDFPGVNQPTYWRNQPLGLEDWPTMIQRLFAQDAVGAHLALELRTLCSHRTPCKTETQDGDSMFLDRFIPNIPKPYDCSYPTWRLDFWICFWCGKESYMAPMICIQPSSNRRGKHQGNEPLKEKQRCWNRDWEAFLSSEYLDIIDLPKKNSFLWRQRRRSTLWGSLFFYTGL